MFFFGTIVIRAIATALLSTTPPKLVIKISSPATNNIFLGGRKLITNIEYESLKAYNRYFYYYKIDIGYLSINYSNRLKKTLNIKAIKDDLNKDSEEGNTKFLYYLKAILT